MAGTTSSSGLNNLLSSTQQVQTTLPSWYDTAQQNIVNQAGTTLGQAPSFGQTTAQGAINTLQGTANPFTQAQNTLNTIGQGAANPWNVDASTGTVTPNINTPLGGLFAAQQNQFNQLLPTTIAPAQAGAVGTGNFGGLRGQTAVDTAKANALANLQAQQMTAALQNQATGSQAAGALGNVGAQGITAGLTTGAAQMNAPFQGLTNYANLVNAISAPATVSQQNQMSPLQMVSTLAGLPTVGTNLLNSLFGQGSGTPGTSGYVPAGLIPTWNSIFGSNSGVSAATQAARDASGTAGINSGNPLADIGGGSMPTNPDGTIDYSGANWSI